MFNKWDNKDTFFSTKCYLLWSLEQWLWQKHFFSGARTAICTYFSDAILGSRSCIIWTIEIFEICDNRKCWREKHMFQYFCVCLSSKVYVQVFSCCQLPVPPVRLQRAVKVKTPLDWGEKAWVFLVKQQNAAQYWPSSSWTLPLGSWVSGKKQQDSYSYNIFISELLVTGFLDKT